MTDKTMRLKGLLAAVVLGWGATQPALATDNGSHQFNETVKQSGREIKLNGKGVRIKYLFKVYSMAMYLPEKASSTEDVLKIDGPRRLTLVMMRDLTLDSFGSAFITALSDNLSEAEKVKLLPQINNFGGMFAMMDSIKKGDELQLNWMPGVGTECLLNGKKIGEFPGFAFYNAISRIWLGEKPVDKALKQALLGAAK